VSQCPSFDAYSFFQQPELWIKDLNTFQQVWEKHQANHEQAIAVLQPNWLKNLDKKGIKTYTVTQKGGLIVIQSLPLATK
jgi:hypothetical protein